MCARFSCPGLPAHRLSLPHTKLAGNQALKKRVGVRCEMLNQFHIIVRFQNYHPVGWQGMAVFTCFSIYGMINLCGIVVLLLRMICLNPIKYYK